MNPLKKLNCLGSAPCPCLGSCYCLFLHSNGKTYKTSKQEREIEQTMGFVRCTREWEISAVKPKEMATIMIKRMDNPFIFHERDVKSKP